MVLDGKYQGRKMHRGWEEEEVRGRGTDERSGIQKWSGSGGPDSPHPKGMAGRLPMDGVNDSIRDWQSGTGEREKECEWDFRSGGLTWVMSMVVG